MKASRRDAWEQNKRRKFEEPLDGLTKKQCRSKKQKNRGNRDKTIENSNDEKICAHCVRNGAPNHVSQRKIRK